MGFQTATRGEFLGSPDLVFPLALFPRGPAHSAFVAPLSARGSRLSSLPLFPLDFSDPLAIRSRR
jgi:hypothetical protein